MMKVAANGIAIIILALALGACGGAGNSSVTTNGTTSTSNTTSSGSSSSGSGGSSNTILVTHELAKMWDGVDGQGALDGSNMTITVYASNGADIFFERFGISDSCTEKWSSTYDDAAKKLTVGTLYSAYAATACNATSPFIAGGVYNWSIAVGTWKVLTITNAGGTTVFTGRTSPL